MDSDPNVIISFIHKTFSGEFAYREITQYLWHFNSLLVDVQQFCRCRVYVIIYKYAGIISD